MKNHLLALTMMALLAGPVLAQTPAPAPTLVYTVATTSIGDLLDKPALKAVFEKYLPTIANHEQINEGRGLTLPDIVQYAADVVTSGKLAAIDAELKALTAQ